jgi:hypothetical protein
MVTVCRSIIYGNVSVLDDRDLENWARSKGNCLSGFWVLMAVLTFQLTREKKSLYQMTHREIRIERPAYVGSISGVLLVSV